VEIVRRGVIGKDNDFRRNKQDGLPLCLLMEEEGGLWEKKKAHFSM